MSASTATYQVLSDIGIRALADVTPTLKKIDIESIRQVRNAIHHASTCERVPLGPDTIRPAWGHLNFLGIRYSDERKERGRYLVNVHRSDRTLFGQANPRFWMSDYDEHPWKGPMYPGKENLLDITEDAWFRKVSNIIMHNIQAHLLSGAKCIIVDNPLATLPVDHLSWARAGYRIWATSQKEEEIINDYISSLDAPESLSEVMKRTGHLSPFQVLNGQLLQDWVGVLLVIKPWVERGEVCLRLNQTIPPTDDFWYVRPYWFSDYLERASAQERTFIELIEKQLRTDTAHHYDYRVYKYRYAPFFETMVESNLLKWQQDLTPLNIPSIISDTFRQNISPSIGFLHHSLSAVIMDLNLLTKKKFEIKRNLVQSQAKDLQYALIRYCALDVEGRVREWESLTRELDKAWRSLWRSVTTTLVSGAAFSYAVDIYSMDMSKIVAAFSGLASLIVKSYLEMRWKKRDAIETSPVGPIWSMVKKT